MKIFKFMIVALVAMCGFASCNDCDHDYIEVDYSKKLAGTWTCVDAENQFAEALIFNADGTVTSTGVFDGGYWEKKGTYKIKGNKIAMSYEDGDNIDIRFEMVEGKVFSMVDDELNVHFNYYYCENDLSDEIVGMWVCNSGLENDMVINTFAENGKSSITTFLADENDYVVNKEGDYKVIGNLLIKTVKGDSDTPASYIVIGLDYMPNGTELGDIMTMYLPAYEAKTTFLRIKQSLDLAGKAYDYIATYISNVKGEDKDVPFLNTSFNFAKMDGSIIDKFLKSTLFSVEFPDANTLKYSFLVGGQNTSMTAPIAVEGNKMTIKMSENNPVFHDIEVYTFQDQNNTQMHLFMPTASFEKFFANTSVHVMLGNGQLDENDTEDIAGVYQTIADAVESINLTIILK